MTSRKVPVSCCASTPTRGVSATRADAGSTTIPAVLLGLRKAPRILALVLAPIHPSAWNKNSANFAETEFYEVAAPGLRLYGLLFFLQRINKRWSVHDEPRPLRPDLHRRTTC